MPRRHEHQDPCYKTLEAGQGGDECHEDAQPLVPAQEACSVPDRSSGLAVDRGGMEAEQRDTRCSDCRRVRDEWQEPPEREDGGTDNRSDQVFGPSLGARHHAVRAAERAERHELGDGCLGGRVIQRAGRPIAEHEEDQQRKVDPVEPDEHCEARE